MRPRRPRAAFSLLELLTVLVLLGVLAALAAPSLAGHLQRARVRGALARLSGDLYHARMVAVRLGARVHVRFVPPTGCAQWYVVTRAYDGAELRRVRIDEAGPGVCLSSNVATAMSIDGRGLLSGSPRTIRAVAGGQRDSIVVSLAGRILRTP